MMNKTVLKSLLLAVGAAALLAGCADVPKTSALLTYDSQPAGAKIYQGQTLLGTAPVTQTYPLEGGKALITTPEVTAVWASGAKNTFWTELKPGDDRATTIERPANAPNLQADLDAAAAWTKTRQADAERDKDQTLRDQKRYSQACLDAMAKGNSTTAASVCN